MSGRINACLVRNRHLSATSLYPVKRIIIRTVACLPVRIPACADASDERGVRLAEQSRSRRDQWWSSHIDVPSKDKGETPPRLESLANSEFYSGGQRLK